MLLRSLKITFVSIAFVALALAQGPPVEPGPFLQPDLFELTRHDPTNKHDKHNTTKNNNNTNNPTIPAIFKVSPELAHKLKE